MDEERTKRRVPYRLLALVGGAALIVLGFSLINLAPDLSHVQLQVLSGPPQGNYHAIVERLDRAAGQEGGELGNLESQGSVENLQRLTSAAADCSAHFALVQDGVPPGRGSELELIGRLPKSESVFIVGRDASRLKEFSQLSGMRIGVGPSASGTDHLARKIFESRDFKPMGLNLSNHDLAKQVSLLRTGQLDLGIFVLDEDAALIRTAIRDHGLELAAFEHLDVLARRQSFVSHGRIGAGQFDPIRVLPREDVRVLRVDTLVVGNDCASRTEVMGLLTLISREFPTFVSHNRIGGGSGYYETSADARAYYANDGPEWADVHLPWLVDIMPIGNWIYVVMSISVLFNLMTTWHRFRLWRVDANRDKVQEVFRKLFGRRRTPSEIALLDPLESHMNDSSLEKLDEALDEMDRLRLRCREQENSMLVPMGHEGAYRYQEEQMENVLTAVREYRRKLEEALQARADGDHEEETAKEAMEEGAEQNSSADSPKPA
jgi:TRAP-type uncharacterized transport system substrate-binding protein